MRYLLVIVLTAYVSSLFAQQQIELDMQRRLALTPATSLNPVSYKGFYINYGLAQRFVLGQPESALSVNQNITGINSSLQSLDRQWDFASNLRGNSAKVDYNLLQGIGVSGAFYKHNNHHTSKKLEQYNVSLSTRYNNGNNQIGEKPVLNQNLNIDLTGGVTYKFNEQSRISSKLLTKLSKRQMTPENVVFGSLSERQNLVALATSYTHNLTTNRKVVLGLQNYWYGGDLSFGSDSLNTKQQINQLYAAYDIARPKLFSSINARIMLANADTKNASYQSWFDISHDLNFKYTNNKFLAGVTNSVNGIDGKLNYTPKVYSRLFLKKFNAYLYAGRYMKQVTSSYEMYPYVKLSQIKPFWLTKDAAGLKTNYSISNQIKLGIEAAYMNFSVPGNTFFELDNLLETSAIVDLDFSSAFHLDLRYTYTPIKKGELAILIPEHLGLVHFNVSHVYVGWLNTLLQKASIYQDISLNAGVLTGYRSNIGYLDAQIINPTRENIVADVYINFTTKYDRKFSFGFEAKNIFNNGAMGTEQHSAYYLFSDGLRLMRTFSFSISKSFN